MKHKDITSAIIGTTFFAIPYLALQITLAPALLMGVAAFGATELVFSEVKKEQIRNINLPLSKVIENARKQNNKIIETIPKIEDEETKDDLKEISSTVKKIIDTVEKKKYKAKDINNFFDYYLPVVVNIIERYDEIENQKLNSKDGKEFMVSASDMIKEANGAFKNILSGMYQSDIVDADAEMKVFNSMIKADGISGDDINVDKEGNNG